VQIGSAVAVSARSRHGGKGPRQIIYTDPYPLRRNPPPPPLALLLAATCCLDISINSINEDTFAIVIAQAPQQVPHRARDDAGLRRRRDSVDGQVGL